MHAARRSFPRWRLGTRTLTTTTHSLRPLGPSPARHGAPTHPAARTYATREMRDPMTGEITTLPDIDPSLLRVTPNPHPGTPPPASKLVFGKTFTDHMLTVKWTNVGGWEAPEIGPYAPLSLEPSSVVLHYANALFEGLKAYRSSSGRITLFRPDMNMSRMNRTAERIALPTFSGPALIELISELVRRDERWIPQEPGHSLYVRPTLIGTQNALGVGPSTSALLFVICSPVGPYYKGGFKPIALLATTKHVRAAPGGIGSYKLAANYAPGIIPQLEAAMEGYAQNLWLWGEAHELTEVGTMNLFVVLKGEDGGACFFALSVAPARLPTISC
ncbi:branched-chain amino acid aminotransferase II [Calocera cornea HHB12733]|uniref:Branched-chain amino acid aminotransferase II n=1 Tax=Calocera cornea HHB12733 TaxID=1353952 RepID=A0A165GT54_9BASI|nr:branched-chain amino acid aminotransferase II [Calocera cornea HHB12733]